MIQIVQMKPGSALICLDRVFSGFKELVFVSLSSPQKDENNIDL